MTEPEALSAPQRAEVLQIDAALHELAGVAAGDRLVARIVAACAAAEDAPRPDAAAGSSRWLWAAALFVGLGVVGTVTWLQDRERHAVTPVQEPSPQDPKPAPTPPGGGSMTLIADYNDNAVYAVDEAGKQLFRLDEIFGAWDAELLPNGNLLLTEFSLSRVREVTRAGKTVWSYENLKNPYSASRLTVGNSAGNTLIADTFAGRIVEVRPDGTEFWSYGDHEHESIRPFDCEQTPTGNFLIADQQGDRVLEIGYHGLVIWEVNNLPSVADADRLPDGNTLVTLRNKGEVRELDRDGKVVWQLTGLDKPNDADRLPNGHTLVAEHERVCEFDPDGKIVWETKTTWSVEANRYPR